MTKTKIAVAALLAICISTPILLQHWKARRLTVENQDLRDEVERLRAERDEFSTAREQLSSEMARMQSNQSDLVRLRGEVTRLRHDLAAAAHQSTNRANLRPAEAPPADTNPARLTPYTTSARVTLQPGETLIIGGWPTAPGKRTLALITPDANAGGRQGLVGVAAVYMQLSEDILSGPGWEAYRSATQSDTPNGVFAPGQAKEFMEALNKLEGVEIMSAPKVMTLSGQEASISTGSISTDDAQEGGIINLNLLPVVAADGRMVDLTVTNTLHILPNR